MDTANQFHNPVKAIYDQFHLIITRKFGCINDYGN
jgi:hypothetical protein